jgi:hypothetical protein
LGDGNDAARVVEHNRAGTGRSLIKRQDVFHILSPKSIGGWLHNAYL